MKLIVLLVAAVGFVAVANGQGTFDPASSSADSSFGAHTAGTVYAAPENGTAYRAYGSTFVGQYYIGPAGTTDATKLVAVGPVAGFLGSSPSSLSAGYYNGDGSGTVITGFAPGSTVVLQLRAWYAPHGESFAFSPGFGSSQLLSLALGGTGSPPSLPTPITSMANFSIYGNVPTAPEPSTLILGLVGASTLLFRRK